MTSLITIKILSLLATFLVATVGTGIPIFYVRKHSHCIFGTALAGGVLLASAIVHLLPDAIETLGHAVPGILCGVIFLALCVFEDLAQTIFGQKELGAADSLIRHESQEMQDANEPKKLRSRCLSSCPQMHSGSGLEGQKVSVCEVCMQTGSIISTMKSIREEATVSPVKSLFLFVALSFHSVVEGFTLGTQRDHHEIIAIITAILVHKGLAGFALGETLRSSSHPRRYLLAMCAIFILCSPIGTIIGMAVDTAIKEEEENPVLTSVCTALAAGTFLQISAMELIPQVFEIEGSSLPKHFGVMIGFLIMAILAFWV